MQFLYRVMVLETNRLYDLGCEEYTKYTAELANLEEGNLSLGWEIPWHPNRCMKH